MWDDVAPSSRYCHGALGRSRLCYGAPPASGDAPGTLMLQEVMDGRRSEPGAVQWEARGILMRDAFG